MRYHVVQPYGRPGEYRDSTVVASFHTVNGAFRYLDHIALMQLQYGIRQDALEFAVVDDEYRPVGRPME